MLCWQNLGVFLISSFFIALTCSAAEPFRLRVLTYNIHHGEGVDGKLDLARIANVIQEVQPDIVALQEVDQNVPRSGRVDQAAELGRLTKMNHIFGGNIDLQGGRYGNALLTRFEIASHQNDKLPNVANGEQRGILSVSIRLPNQQESISVFATHFDHRRSDEERVLSGEQTNSMVNGKGLAILMGDINDIIGSRTMDLLDRNWKRVNDVPLPTIPVSEPKRQIDFILVRPADRWKMVETKVVEEPIASDHRPFFAVIEFH